MFHSQMPEHRISIQQLRQVIGHRVIHTPDVSLPYSHSAQHGGQGLGYREYSGDGRAVKTPVVFLELYRIVLNDNNRARSTVLHKLSECHRPPGIVHGSIHIPVCIPDKSVQQPFLRNLLGKMPGPAAPADRILRKYAVVINVLASVRHRAVQDTGGAEGRSADQEDDANRRCLQCCRFHRHCLFFRILSYGHRTS